MNAGWLKCLGSATCLAALLWWTDTGSVLGHLRNLDLTWVLAAFAALTLATCAMAHRWQITARAFEMSLSYPFALREYYLAQLINAALPGGVTGDVTRAVRVRAHADLTSAAQSVMAERLLGQIAIFAALAIGFAFTLLRPSNTMWGVWSWVIPAAIMIGFAACYGLAHRSTASGRFLQRTIALAKHPAIVLHGLIATAALIFALYASARAVGIVIPPSGWLTLIPLVLCAMLVPLSIGGWGWREGAAAALFPLISAPPSAGVATGITYGIIILLAALPAAFILLFHSISILVHSNKEPQIP